MNLVWTRYEMKTVSATALSRFHISSPDKGQLDHKLGPFGKALSSDLGLALLRQRLRAGSSSLACKASMLATSWRLFFTRWLISFIKTC